MLIVRCSKCLKHIPIIDLNKYKYWLSFLSIKFLKNLDLVETQDDTMLNKEVSKAAALGSYDPAKFFFVNQNENYLRRIEEIYNEDSKIG